MITFTQACIIVGYPKIIDRPEFAEENEAIRKVTDVEKMKEAAKTFSQLLVEGAIASQSVGNSTLNTQHSTLENKGIPVIFMGMKEPRQLSSSPIPIWHSE